MSTVFVNYFPYPHYHSRTNTFSKVLPAVPAMDGTGLSSSRMPPVSARQVMFTMMREARKTLTATVIRTADLR